MPDSQAQRLGRWLLGLATIVLVVGDDHGPPGPAMTVLELSNVRYRYAGASAWALDGIDLILAAGDVVGLVGANDAGKSTLCLVAAGLAPGSIGGALEGSVRIGGVETRSSLRTRSPNAADPVPERRRRS